MKLLASTAVTLLTFVVGCSVDPAGSGASPSVPDADEEAASTDAASADTDSTEASPGDAQPDGRADASVASDVGVDATAGDVGVDATVGDAPVVDASATDTLAADTSGGDSAPADAPAADTAKPDLGTDAGPISTLTRGQCYANAQCPSGECRADAPGGICGCGGGTSSCSSTTYACSGVTCALDCTTSLDCAAGMRCGSGGACLLKTCASDGECPSTTVCRPLGMGGTSYCLRKLCGDPAVTCPSGTTCRAAPVAGGKACVEDGLAF
jgi:hypothetical protein